MLFKSEPFHCYSSRILASAIRGCSALCRCRSSPYIAPPCLSCTNLHLSLPLPFCSPPCFCISVLYCALPRPCNTVRIKTTLCLSNSYLLYSATLICTASHCHCQSHLCIASAKHINSYPSLSATHRLNSFALVLNSLAILAIASLLKVSLCLCPTMQNLAPAPRCCTHLCLCYSHRNKSLPLRLLSVQNYSLPLRFSVLLFKTLPLLFDG